MLKISFLTLVLLVLSGCGGEGQGNSLSVINEETAIETVEPLEMTSDLQNIARSSANIDDFTRDSIYLIKEDLISEYVPYLLQSYVSDSDIFNVDNLAADETVQGYIQELYTKLRSTSSKAPALNEVTSNSIITDIIDYLKSMIFEWINTFFTIDDEGENTDSIDENSTDDVYVPKDDTPIEFTLELIKGKTFYVISSKVDMVVSMSADGLSGSGSMGFISMDFTDHIQNNGLAISTTLMGEWIIDINYLEAGYCIAADAISESGDQYESYWFSDQSIEAQATTLKSAKALCYANASEGEKDDVVVIEEGSLTTIEDIRTGHTVVAGTNAKELVEGLLSLNNNVDLDDAKYFARSMRNGPLSLYTTNNQTHDLLSLVSGDIMRELVPQGLGSALGMKSLLEESYLSATAFQTEVTEDLNTTLLLFGDRMSEIASSAAIAMDIAADNQSSGSHTTSYGDKVSLSIGNLNTNICLVFFLCESSVDGDAYLTIANEGTDGNKANVAFKTHFNATSMDVSAIQFNRVVSTNNINIISSDNYTMNLSGFLFDRSNGTLDLEGSGDISASTGAQTQALVDAFDIRVFVSEYGALNFSPNALNAALDGSVTTDDGRSFDGKLYFDAHNTQNNELNGTLVGINSEPTIEGVFKTSLSFKDLDWWINGRDDVTFEKGMPYLVSADGTIELLSSLTNFSRVEAKTFETFDNRYNCTQNNDGTYACRDIFDTIDKTLKFLEEDEVLLVSTNNGDYYIVNIQNIRNFSLSTIVMLKEDTREQVNLSEFDYKDASISNIRVVSANINDPYTIDTIGEHVYSMDVLISKGSQSLSADILMKNIEDENLWEYYIKDLNISDDFGQMGAQNIYISQVGINGLAILLDELALASYNIEFDIESLLTLGWNSLNPFKAISIDGFIMKVNASQGEAKIQADINFVNSTQQYDMDANLTFDYAQTSITSNILASVSVGDENSYDSNLSATGEITAADHPSYSYSVDYTESEQFVYLQRQDTSYQMGFIINGLSSMGADSYGVKADFITNEKMDTLEVMNVKDNTNTILGSYKRSEDALKIFYDISDTEYLYIY